MKSFDITAEQRDKLLLQFATHIDQQVATTNEIELGKGWVFDYVLLGKDHHIADAFVDAVNASIRFQSKKP